MSQRAEIRRLGIRNARRAGPPHGTTESLPLHAVVEAALAHVVKNKAEVVYARIDLFEKRRALMRFWSAHFAG